MNGPSAHLARALPAPAGEPGLPPTRESTRRSDARPAPAADIVDRVLLAAAALSTLAALLLLWQSIGIAWGL